MAKDDKLKGKPRSVRAAQKAGSKYFFDKNGVKKLAVTAEQLKKTGLTLRQWANQTNSSGKLKKKPEGGIKVKKPDGKITVTKLAPTDRTGKVLSAAEKQLNKKSRDDKMDATTAKSMAGSSTVIPPVTCKKTSVAPKRKPARFSKTANNIFKRLALKPVAERCGVP